MRRPPSSSSRVFSERNLLLLLKRIATAAVLIPIVLVLVLRAPVSVVALVAALVALLTVHEFLKLTESYGVRPLRTPTYAFVAGFFFLLAINVGAVTPLFSTGKFLIRLAFAAAIAPFLFLTITTRPDTRGGAYPVASAAVVSFA